MWIKTGRPNPPFIFQLVPRLQLDKLKSRCRRQPNLMYRNFNAVTKCRGVPACTYSGRFGQVIIRPYTTTESCLRPNLFLHRRS